MAGVDIAPPFVTQIPLGMLTRLEPDLCECDHKQLHDATFTPLSTSRRTCGRASPLAVALSQLEDFHPHPLNDVGDIAASGSPTLCGDRRSVPVRVHYSHVLGEGGKRLRSDSPSHMET